MFFVISGISTLFHLINATEDMIGEFVIQEERSGPLVIYHLCFAEGWAADKHRIIISIWICIFSCTKDLGRGHRVLCF